MPGLFLEWSAEGSNDLELELYERHAPLDHEAIEEYDEANRAPKCPPGYHQPLPLPEGPRPLLLPQCRPKQLSAPRCQDQQGTERLQDEATKGSDHARENAGESDAYSSPASLDEGECYVSGGAAGFPESEDISPRTSVDGPDGGFWEPQQRSQGQVRGGEKGKPGKDRKQGTKETEKKKGGGR